MACPPHRPVPSPVGSVPVVVVCRITGPRTVHPVGSPGEGRRHGDRGGRHRVRGRRPRAASREWARSRPGGTSMVLTPDPTPPSRGWSLRTVPAALENRWVAAGHWDDRTLGGQLDGALRTHAGQVFRIHSEQRPWTGTFGAVAERARRLAGALRERGVGPGDAVAFQLPNWVEAAVTFYAGALLGAVIVPIVHFYGPKEVGYILRRTGVRVLVTPSGFGHTDHLAGLAQMENALTDVHTIAVVGAPAGPLPRGLLAFDELEATGTPLDGPLPVDPGSAAIVAYTSGTTA